MPVRKKFVSALELQADLPDDDLSTVASSRDLQLQTPRGGMSMAVSAELLKRLGKKSGRDDEGPKRRNEAVSLGGRG